MKTAIKIFVIMGVLAWLTALTVFFYLEKLENTNKFRVLGDALYVDITRDEFNKQNGFVGIDADESSALNWVIYKGLRF